MSHSEGFLSIVDASRGKVREVSIAEAKARLDAGARVVDVREDREWALGHIQGAAHMGKGIIERDIEGAIPDKGAELILYCGGGFRSILAADALRQMGYRNVASMAGGWRGWVAAGYPVDM